MATTRLAASELVSRIDIGNYIDRSARITTKDPRLSEGEWVGEPPKNQEDIGWEEFVRYESKGERPDGTKGGVSLTATIGTSTARVEWAYTSAPDERYASFNGNKATDGKPYNGTWEGQKVTLEANLRSNRLDILLNIGNQQEP